MGSKSLFCFRKSEICILNTVSTEVTLAPSNLAFSGSILHILFSSSRHCLTFTCGHQKRFTNGNVWTRINLKTDKYLSVFKFIRIRVDGALIGSLHLLLAGLSVLRLLLSSLQKGKQIMSNFVLKGFCSVFEELLVSCVFWTAYISRSLEAFNLSTGNDGHISQELIKFPREATIVKKMVKCGWF